MDAIDDLSDALEATRNFLTPVRADQWVKLALVVVFVSSLGIGVGPSFQASDFAVIVDDPTFGLEELEGLETAITVEDLIAAALVIGAIALVLWLGYALLAGIMEFVFLESLRSDEVRVRRYFGTNLGNGGRLFLFRLGLVLAFGALGVVPLLAVAARGGDLTAFAAGGSGLYLLYAGGLYLAHSILRRFTDEFVAPIMLLEDRGVLSAWRRLWEPLRANWTEYGLYLLLVWFIYIAVAATAWVVVGLGAVALAIPFLIAIIVLIQFGQIGGLLALLTVVLAFVTILLFMAFVWMPITVYFQYYALLLLGDTDGDLDLVPDQRAAIRGVDGGSRRRDDWSDRESATRDGTDGEANSDRTPRESDPWDDDVDPWDETGETESDDPWDDSSASEDSDFDRDDSDDPDDDDDRGW